MSAARSQIRTQAAVLTLSLALIVSTNAAALSFLESHPIDAAILDYRLSDGTSKPLMEWLREHQTPFVIISGWVEMLPNEAGAAPILEKPLLHDELCQALSDLLH